MNINNEQRKAFAKIIEQNGRSQEFYNKYGKDRVVKNEAEAKKLLAILVANDKAEEVLKEKQRKEEKNLENRIRKDNRIAEKKMEALGYGTEKEWEDGDYIKVLSEDKSITNAEYEMFKKRALTAVWSAESLEVGKKAIDNYLNLVK